jgi:hypothetical protein
MSENGTGQQVAQILDCYTMMCVSKSLNSVIQVLWSLHASYVTWMAANGRNLL